MAGGGVAVTLTEYARKVLDAAASDEGVPEELRARARAALGAPAAPWTVLRDSVLALNASCTEDAPARYSLADALAGSALALPSPPAPTRSAAAEARIRALKRAQEDREYAAMVADVTAAERRAKEKFEDPLSSFQNQLSFGVNLMVSVGCFAGLGYYAARHVSPDNPGHHALAAVGGIVLALLVDVTALILRQVYPSEAREAFRRKYETPPPRRGESVAAGGTAEESAVGPGGKQKEE
ncbi:unnamed protein product [Pedinophyceae sp. YPF-701]|nr:unnamed protein product [Pedinophyceae sp. YPF-701]